MRHKLDFLAKMSIVSGLAVLTASPVFASTTPIPANPPASKCVTASTKALHDKYAAQQEKDIAPYASNGNAEKPIKTYKDGLDIAWEAMEEPYCGDGIYGITPFVKSYTKSADRERATFLAAVKTLPKNAVVAAPPAETVPTPAPEPAPVAVKTEPAAETKAEVKPEVKAAVIKAKLHIDAGLHRGMRSDRVKQLQSYLAARYKVSTDDLVTGYFGPMTEKYLLKFQLEEKVVGSASSPGAGMFGPKTSAALDDAQ
jgi:hypothetical protein